MGATVHRAKKPIPTSFPALKTLFMMILINKEKISALKLTCLGAPLCAYIFALSWCVNIGMTKKPDNACVKSNSHYFKSKYQKL